jgi:hypothetical protein
VSRRRLGGTPQQRLLLGTLAVGAALLAWFLWIGTMNADLGFGPRVDPYNMLGDAFVHGRTWLDLPIPEGLRALPDPYDPATHGPYVDYTITDLAYFDGQLYAYWGPAPAVLIFAPAHALGLASFPPMLALLLLLVGGLACAAAFLYALVRRHFPATLPWMLALALAALGLSGLEGYLLQQSRMYEIAIAGGFCFTWAAILSLAHAVWRRSLPLLALSSLCFGLAFASRPNVALLALCLPVAALWAWRRAGRPALLALAAAGGPMAVCVVLFGLYNHARFGSYGDFGFRYLLGGLEQYDRSTGDLAYVPVGLWFYLLAPVRWRLQFPFAYLPPPPTYPGTLPAGWGSVDMTGGLLWTTPVLLMIGSLPVLWRRLSAQLRVALGGLVVGGAVVAVALTFVLFAVAQRYEVDFVALLLVPALGCWLALSATASTPRRRTVARRVGAVAIVYGCVIAMATALNGSGPPLRVARPGTFSALESAFSFVPVIHAAVTGAPHIVGNGHSAGIRPAALDRLTLDGAEFVLGKQGTVLQISSPRTGNAVMVAKVQPLMPWQYRSQLAIEATASPSGSKSLVGFEEPKTREIPVTLRRGMNDVALRIVGFPPLRNLDTDPDANAILHVLSLHVRF